MEYSHSGRLEGFRNLYMALADERKDLYSVKEQWESVSEDLDEVYFWTAVEDMYQNELLDVDGLHLSGSNEFELADFSVDSYEELNRVRVPREWKIDSQDIEVFTDHFERHDKPDSTDYSIGNPKSSLEINREIDKGDKSIKYLLENNNEEKEASLRLEVEFNIPDFSPEVEDVFLKYASNYLSKLERQEVNTLKKRAGRETSEGQKSTAI